MLEVLCPRCGNLHHADEAHTGKMLRCTKCGDGVQIGTPSYATSIEPAKPVEDAGSPPHKSRRRKKPNERSSIALSKNQKITLWITSIATICVLVACSAYVWLHADKTTEDIFERISRANAKERVDAKAQAEAAKLVDNLHPAQSTDSEMHRTLPSGTRVRSDAGTYGKGILTIDNFAGSDSLVKVVSAFSGRTIRYVFIQQSSKVDLREIPQGTYKVRFCFGDDWDSQLRHFTRTDSFFEFGQKLIFEETTKDDGIEYSHHEITLHATPDGNVPRVEINKAVFDFE